MNACFCNGIQNPPTWRVFLLEWVAVLRVEWVAGLVSLQVEGFDRYVWLSWGGIRRWERHSWDSDHGPSHCAVHTKYKKRPASASENKEPSPPTGTLGKTVGRTLCAATPRGAKEGSIAESRSPWRAGRSGLDMFVALSLPTWPPVSPCGRTTPSRVVREHSDQRPDTRPPVGSATTAERKSAI